VVSLVYWVFKRGFAPLLEIFPFPFSLIIKGKGIKGIGLTSNPLN
jgi:hypothetical protein